MKHLKPISTGQNKKHATSFNGDQVATAPYNFVSMPENVFVWDLREGGALDEALPSHDRYHEGRFTGWIDITITTETDTYIRAGLEAEPDDDNPESEFQKHKKNQNRKWNEAKRDFFYLAKDGSPVIPGSSLRGLMRNLVEIATSGKMTQVDAQVPRLRNSNGPVKSPLDLVPAVMKNPAYVDFAESMFGFVRSDKEIKQTFGNNVKQGDRRRAYRGRLRFLPAFPSGEVKSSNDIVVPPILSGPSAKSHRMYLTQPKVARTEQVSYDNEGVQLRGRKLYWHRKDTLTDPRPRDTDTQHTQMKPVPGGLAFKARVHFENLTDTELGALLWVMRPSVDSRHKIGMGRPHGYGSVKITVDDVRVVSLGKSFEFCNLQCDPSEKHEAQKSVNTFTSLMKAKQSNYFELPHMKEFLMMLESKPDPLRIKTMGIQGSPSFKEVGRVLPGPKTVVNGTAPTAVQPPHGNNGPHGNGQRRRNNRNY